MGWSQAVVAWYRCSCVKAACQLVMIVVLTGGAQSLAAEARLESSVVVEEGLLNPDDWVYRFSVAAGASVVLGCTDQRLAPLVAVIKFHRLAARDDQPDRDQYQMVIGGAVRARAAIAGVVLSLASAPRLFHPIAADAPAAGSAAPDAIRQGDAATAAER